MASTIDLGIEHLSGVELLGRGGFSLVYAATDDRFDRRVAIKVLNQHLGDRSEQSKFERECRVMGRLSSHPNVVTVFDSGATPDGSPYLIMELVEGGSLADRLEADGPLSWAEAIDAVLPITAAVARAHESGVLHRDIKPENILISDDAVKLTDFGISSVRDSSGATSANIAVSWLHAPPETFPNKRDTRSDLYSLASTLYTLIVGTPPLWRDDEDSIEPLMYRILHEPAPPLPSGLAPPELDHFLQRALAKDPAHRPQTAEAFGAELASIRAGTVRPSSPDSIPASGVDTAVVGAPGPGPDPNDSPSGHRSDRRSGPGRAVMVAMAAGLAAAGVGVIGYVALADRSDDDAGQTASERVPADDAGSDPSIESAPSAADPTSSTTSPTPSSSTATTTTEPPSISTSTSAATTATTATTTNAAPAARVPSYSNAGIGTFSADIDALSAFLFDHRNEIVQLEVTVFLADNRDFFQDGDDTFMTMYTGCRDTLDVGETPNALDCEGYSLRFLNQSAGTSFVGFRRGDEYQIFGYFQVGATDGPRQGLLTQVLDPVTSAVALSQG